MEIEMKYTLEKLLALSILEGTIWDSIKNAQVTEDGILEFDADLKSKRGKYKRELVKLLRETIREEYIRRLGGKMLAEGYLCIPIPGGWLVLSPSGEEYQLTENECTCNDKTLLSYDGPCKHLLLRDFLNLYRAKVQKEKTKRGL